MGSHMAVDNDDSALRPVLMAVANTTRVPDRVMSHRNHRKATDIVTEVVIGPSTDFTNTKVAGEWLNNSHKVIPKLMELVKAHHSDT